MIRLRAPWVVPVCAPPVRDGSVVVDGARIVAVGTSRELAAAFPSAKVRDLGDVALSPGFVDSHCHVEWSLAESAAPPCSGGFAEWLAGMLAAGAAMLPSDFLAAARLGVVKALRAGTTLMLDAGPTGAAATAAVELGMRAHVHLEAFGRLSGVEAEEYVRQFAPRVVGLDGPLVRGGVSPHAPYTVGPELWRALAAHPDLSGRPWMTHIAESAQEESAIAGRGGPLADLFTSRGSSPGIWTGDGSVVARLAQADALRPGMVAAHCVQLHDGDHELLHRSGVGVAHCPQSNAFLGVGEHDIRATIDHAVSAGLGSDSPATAGAFDVRAVARAAKLEPEAQLRLATAGGAQVAGRAHELGVLRPGYLADLTATTLRAGERDPVAAILDPDSSVEMTMVNGRAVVSDGCLVSGDESTIAEGAVQVLTRSRSSNG